VRRHHPQYLELPFPTHFEEHVLIGWRKHWLLIVILALLAIFLIGVNTIGGVR
jgi:hypothetical protein